jgi:uncharacterized membrane protein
LFFIIFLGTAVTSIALAVSGIWQWGQLDAIYLFGGSALYLIGTIFVTIVFNVPMNEALDKVQPNSTEGAVLWNNYLTRWTNWNHLRTVTAFLGSVLFILALW